MQRNANNACSWIRGGLIACCLLLIPIDAGAFDVETQRQLADGLYSRGLYDLALDEYLRLSREVEDLDELDLVLYRIGESHRRLNNPQAAERFYIRVIREFPDSAYFDRASFRRAETWITRGRYLEGLNHFQALLEREDLTESLVAPALYYLGDASRRLNFIQQAVDAYQQAMETDPDSAFAAYAALDLASIYKQDPDQRHRVLPLYEGVAANPPTEAVAAEAFFQIGDWHFMQGDYAASAAAYEQLLSKHPDHERSREARLQAAWALYNIGRHADAARMAEAQVSAEPLPAQGAEWLYLLANSQRQLLRTENAEATYTRLIEAFPEHDWARIARYEMALLAFRRDEFATAIEAAEAIEPDAELEQDLFWLLAESYAAVGRDDEAVQYYRRVIDTDPTGPQAPGALYRLGRILQQRRDYVAAGRTYRQLVEAFPDDNLAPAALLAAAFSMVMADRLDEALADWAALIEAYPDHALAEEARYQRALALMQEGRQTEARAGFTSFTERHPDSAFAAEAWYWLAVLAQQDNDYAAAEAALRQALERDDIPAELHARIQFRLAVNLQRQDKAEEAADRLQQLIADAEAVSIPAALLDWLTRYRLVAEAYAKAETAARALAATDSTEAWQQIAWALIGQSLLGQDQTAEAVSAFERSLTFDARTRDGAEAAWTLGDIHIQQAQPESARPWFNQAAEWSSDDRLIDIRARSFFGLGQAAELEDDFRRAARYYLAVAIFFDDDNWVPRALSRGAAMLEQDGRLEEQKRALTELAERFPDWVDDEEGQEQR